MDLNVFLGSVSAIAAVVAIWQTYRANRLASGLARASSDVKIQLFGEVDTHEFIIAVPIRPDRVVEMPMTLHLTNEGRRSAKQLELFLRIPRRLIFGGRGYVTLQIADDSPLKLRSIAQTDHIETWLVTIPAINPGVSIALQLSLSLASQTLHESTMDAEFKDGRATVPLKAYFANVIQTVLAQSDAPLVTAK